MEERVEYWDAGLGALAIGRFTPAKLLAMLELIGIWKVLVPSVTPPISHADGPTHVTTVGYEAIRQVSYRGATTE